MTTITVKNIPEDIYEKLKRSAELNHRSLNREIIACLERAVSSQVIDVETVLAGARQIREKTARYSITEAEFDQAKSAGRE